MPLTTEKHSIGATVSNRLGVASMTLIVISAMVGGGIFNLPQNMARAASLTAVLLAWALSALGTFCLVRTFQALADVRPDLKSGIYMYARHGFGRYAGFQIAWGYWLSAIFANVAYGILLMDTLNYFFPPYFTGGNTWQSIILISAIIWIMNGLVLLGVKSAAALNFIGTVGKFIPVAIFIFMVAISTKMVIWDRALGPDTIANPIGVIPLGGLLGQIKSTMLVTLWVYIGVEGAVVVSDRSDQKTVGRATIVGFAIVTGLYVAMSALPFGLLSQGTLSRLTPPAAAAILGSLVGKWGEYLINTGVIIALLSSWLVWTILLAELPWAGAKDGSFPAVFARTNRHGAGSVALCTSTAIMQGVVILVYFVRDAWDTMLSITGVMILPAYIGSTAFLLQLLATGRYPVSAGFGTRQAMVMGALGTAYGLWLVYAAGTARMFAGVAFFALGTPVFLWARKENAPGEAPLTRREWAAAALITLLGAFASWLLLSDRLGQRD